MYEAFFGLKEKPFNLTPDPRFLFLSDKHKEAFAHLLFGIKQRCGFIMVTGEIGTGKTTICRTLLSQLDENTEVAFIFNPCLSPEELLRTINEDFGISSQADTVKGLIDELNEHLLSRAAKGKNCVLVIDEAQNLAPKVLEQIRLLSNLETETNKLLQIVLIGQPELAQTLATVELRQLNQRITARYHLKPLNEDETLQYIAYRLRVAGGRRKVQFSRGAVRRVYRVSGGTPRVINAVCDRALLIAYIREVRNVTAGIVRRAATEIRGERIRGVRKSALRRYLPSPAMSAAVILIVLVGQFLVKPFTATQREANPSVPTPAPVAGANLSPDASRAEPGTVVASVKKPGDEMAEANRQIEAAKEPPVPPLLRLLDSVDPSVGRNAAAVGILREWGVTLQGSYPASDSVESLARFARENGLECQILPASLDQLAAINLPAFVKIAGDRQVLWVGLVGLTEGAARITANAGEQAEAPRDLFNARYLKQAVIPWRDPAPRAPVLQLESRGEEVQVLQAQLGALGLLQGTPTGTYDAQTADAISALQREVGLAPDGKAGKQTRMVLCSRLPGFAAPSLTKGPRAGAQQVVRIENPPAPEKPPSPLAARPAKADKPAKTPARAAKAAGEAAAPDVPAEPAPSDSAPSENVAKADEGLPPPPASSAIPEPAAPRVEMKDLGPPAPAAPAPESSKAEPPSEVAAPAPDAAATGAPAATAPSLVSAPLVPHEPEGAEGARP